MSADLEQHFILRVPNPEVANKLRGWLRDQASIEGQMSLVFEASDANEGVLTVDGATHRVVLQNLPTVVESYKTLDDANLVKVADIGQVLLVVDPSIHNLPYPCTQQECPDGVTPPMRKARARHFQPPINIPEPMMKDAVTDVLEMLAGRPPDGYTFHDVEEEYVVDPQTGQGRWQQVKATKQPRHHVAAEAAPTTGRQPRAQQRRKKRGSDDDEDLSMSDMTDSD